MSSGMGHDLALDLDLALAGRRKRAPAELESLVMLARDLASLPEPDIDPRFAAILEQRLLTEQIDEAPVPARRLQAVPESPQPEPPVEPVRRAPVVPLPRRRFVFKRGLVAAVAAAMLVAFPIVASASSLPGGILHSFKINVLERIELAFAGGPVDDGFKHLDFADRRIDEIGQLLALGSESAVPGALAMMQSEQIAGVEVILDATRDPAILARAARMLEAQAGKLVTIAKTLSLDVRPAALDAAAAAKALAARLSGAPGGRAGSGSAEDSASAAGAASSAASRVAKDAGTFTTKVTSQVPVPEPDTPEPPTGGGGNSQPSHGCLGDAYLGLPVCD